MKISTLVVVGAALLLPVSALAQGKKGSSYTPPPYGMAGCGLGSLFFGKAEDNKAGQQIVAAYLNDAVFPQTSAITSGTSNCEDSAGGSAEALRKERETYVSVNLNDLSKDASKGDGNYLRGLAEMIGCGSDQQFAAFAAVSQKDHAQIFSDSDASNVTGRFIAKARETEDLRGCVVGN
ncbi:MAG: DUF3015 domain-containing protein [Betaproteobacteria bacterium]|nr:DUF3015 domain-containing protein [Betaproteobacteria bacterium]